MCPLFKAVCSMVFPPLLCAPGFIRDSRRNIPLNNFVSCHLVECMRYFRVSFCLNTALSMLSSKHILLVCSSNCSYPKVLPNMCSLNVYFVTKCLSVMNFHIFLHHSILVSKGKIKFYLCQIEYKNSNCCTEFLRKYLNYLFLGCF